MVKIILTIIIKMKKKNLKFREINLNSFKIKIIIYKMIIKIMIIITEKLINLSQMYIFLL